MATQEVPIRPRPRKIAAIADAPVRTEIQILENPLGEQDAQLGRAVEQAIRQVLETQELGSLQVRFRLCRDEPEGMRFICKVETPLTVREENGAPAWRWWSPLLESARDLRAALEEALEVREQRLASLPYAVV